MLPVTVASQDIVSVLFASFTSIVKVLSAVVIVDVDCTTKLNAESVSSRESVVTHVSALPVNVEAIPPEGIPVKLVPVNVGEAHETTLWSMNV